MSTLVFETERLRVRHFTRQDGDQFFAINGDPEVMRYIRPPKTRADCDRFLDEVVLQNKDGFCLNRFAAEEKATGEFVGSFALIPVGATEKIQLGYALVPEHWGKGFATELTRTGIAYFFRETNSQTLYAITEEKNVASNKVLIRCGFREHRRYQENDREMLEFLYRE